MEINEPHAAHFCHLTNDNSTSSIEFFYSSETSENRAVIVWETQKATFGSFYSSLTGSFVSQQNIIIGSLVPPRRESKVPTKRIINCKSHSSCHIVSANCQRVDKKIWNSVVKCKLQPGRRGKKVQRLKDFLIYFSFSTSIEFG